MRKGGSVGEGPISTMSTVPTDHVVVQHGAIWKGGGFGEKADTRTDVCMHRVNMKPHVNVFDRNGENCRYTIRQGEFGENIHWRVDLIVLQFV